MRTQSLYQSAQLKIHVFVNPSTIKANESEKKYFTCWHTEIIKRGINLDLDTESFTTITKRTYKNGATARFRLYNVNNKQMQEKISGFI